VDRVEPAVMIRDVEVYHAVIRGVGRQALFMGRDSSTLQAAQFDSLSVNGRMGVSWMNYPLDEEGRPALDSNRDNHLQSKLQRC
jgi:hypothetical protein